MATKFSTTLGTFQQLRPPRVEVIVGSVAARAMFAVSDTVNNTSRIGVNLVHLW